MCRRSDASENEEATAVKSRQTKLSQTTHIRDISSSVTVLRERHPLEGRSLTVLGTERRRGILLVLVILPDGSRSLIPASWTNWESDGGSLGCGLQSRERCLASLADLLHARAVVDSLLSRRAIREPAAHKESWNAVDPELSRTFPSTKNTRHKDRSGSTRRSNQDTGTHHRASLSKQQNKGR